MENILKGLTTGWNFFRIARLVLGIAALIQAIIIKEWPLGLAGLFIAGMALANSGCGLAGCAPRQQFNHYQGVKNEEIIYEELDAKK